MKKTVDRGSEAVSHFGGRDVLWRGFEYGIVSDGNSPEVSRLIEFYRLRQDTLVWQMLMKGLGRSSLFAGSKMTPNFYFQGR